jgi:hypothetical protein
MAVMLSKTCDALIAAGTPEDKAREAFEAELGRLYALEGRGPIPTEPHPCRN